jgi:hypothetical protein
MHTTDAVLERAATTFKERIPVYGNNAPKVGNALLALFPDGVTLRTAEDFTRMYLFMMLIAKEGRYANNFTNKGHADSLIDIAVFAAMLHSTDELRNINDQRS